MKKCHILATGARNTNFAAVAEASAPGTLAGDAAGGTFWLTQPILKMRQHVGPIGTIGNAMGLTLKYEGFGLTRLRTRAATHHWATGLMSAAARKSHAVKPTIHTPEHKCGISANETAA